MQEADVPCVCHRGNDRPGVNVKAVTKSAIGVEGSGKGTVYVDDLRPYRVDSVQRYRGLF